MSAGDFTGSLQVLEKGPKARIYVNKTGRFTQPDTIVPGYTNPQNLNRSTYVGNNPLNYIDPSGHDQTCAIWLDNQCAVYQMAGGTKVGRDYSDTPAGSGNSDNQGEVSGEQEQGEDNPGDLDEDLEASAGAPKVRLSQRYDGCPVGTIGCKVTRITWYNPEILWEELDSRQLRNLFFETVQLLNGFGIFGGAAGLIAQALVDALLVALQQAFEAYDMYTDSGEAASIWLEKVITEGITAYLIKNKFWAAVPYVGPFVNIASIGAIVAEVTHCYRRDYYKLEALWVSSSIYSGRYVEEYETHTLVDPSFCW